MLFRFTEGEDLLHIIKDYQASCCGSADEYNSPDYFFLNEVGRETFYARYFDSNLRDLEKCQDAVKRDFALVTVRWASSKKVLKLWDVTATWQEKMGTLGMLHCVT